jgi:hypothetical protein
VARVKAIAESFARENPRGRPRGPAPAANPSHPQSTLYASPDGGSVRLTWSPVNQTWLLLWPGDAPVERQQVLAPYQQWEEGDREARRITSGSAENPRRKNKLIWSEWAVATRKLAADRGINFGDLYGVGGDHDSEVWANYFRQGLTPAEAVEKMSRPYPTENPHGDPPGTSLRGFHVILRGGRPSVRVMAISKYDAEQQVRGWGAPDLYPIWYILSDEEVAQQNIGQNIVENPRSTGTNKTIVLAWTEDESEAYGPEARVDLGQRRAFRPVKVAYAALWKASGGAEDITKAQAYADQSNANEGRVKHFVFSYPTTDRDWKEHAKRDVLKAAH